MLIALVPALLIGFVNGIGVGVFRVHPLIMTLGTSLIGVGCLQVYQRTVIATGTKDPGLPGLARHRPDLGLPECAAAVRSGRPRCIIFTQRRTGFGRLLYAIGDNERATRLVRRAVLAGDPGALHRLGAARRRSPGCSTSA